MSSMSKSDWWYSGILIWPKKCHNIWNFKHQLLKKKSSNFKKITGRCEYQVSCIYFQAHQVLLGPCKVKELSRSVQIGSLVIHRDRKSWDSTTWFRIWQFQTSAWTRYLQMHLLAEQFFLLGGSWSGFYDRGSHDLPNIAPMSPLNSPISIFVFTNIMYCQNGLNTLLVFWCHEALIPV